MNEVTVRTPMAEVTLAAAYRIKILDDYSIQLIDTGVGAEDVDLISRLDAERAALQLLAENVDNPACLKSPHWVLINAGFVPCRSLKEAQELADKLTALVGPKYVAEVDDKYIEGFKPERKS